MLWSMDAAVTSFPNLNYVKLSYFTPKSIGQMVCTSLREVSSCWQQDMNLPFGVSSLKTFHLSEGSSAKSLVIDHPVRSVLHHTPEKWLTDLSLTCSLTCPAGAERKYCGVETTGHPAPPATRCNPRFCCSRQSGRRRPEDSNQGLAGVLGLVIQARFREE